VSIKLEPSSLLKQVADGFGGGQTLPSDAAWRPGLRPPPVATPAPLPSCARDRSGSSSMGWYVGRSGAASKFVGARVHQHRRTAWAEGKIPALPAPPTPIVPPKTGLVPPACACRRGVDVLATNG